MNHTEKLVCKNIPSKFSIYKSNKLFLILKYLSYLISSFKCFIYNYILNNLLNCFFCRRFQLESFRSNSIYFVRDLFLRIFSVKNFTLSIYLLFNYIFSFDFLFKKRLYRVLFGFFSFSPSVKSFYLSVFMLFECSFYTLNNIV